MASNPLLGGSSSSGSPPSSGSTGSSNPLLPGGSAPSGGSTAAKQTASTQKKIATGLAKLNPPAPEGHGFFHGFVDELKGLTGIGKTDSEKVLDSLSPEAKARLDAQFAARMKNMKPVSPSILPALTTPGTPIGNFVNKLGSAQLNFVRKHTGQVDAQGNPLTGHAIAEKLLSKVPGFNEGSKSGVGKVAGTVAKTGVGFLADVGEDPLTYETLGAGIPKEAVREGLSSAARTVGNEEAAKTLSQNAAISTSRNLIRKLPGGGDVLKQASPELRGDLGVRIPLSGGKIVPIIPGALKDRVVSAVAENKPLQKITDALVNPLDSGRAAIHAGQVAGVRATREGMDAGALLDKQASPIAKDFNKLLPEEKVAVRDAIESGDLSSLVPKHRELATRIQTLSDKTYQQMTEAGSKVAYRQNRFPRVLSDEYHLARGGEPGDFHGFDGGPRLNRAEKQRLLDMPLPEANKFLKERYGLTGDAYEMDPAKALAREYQGLPKQLASYKIQQAGKQQGFILKDVPSELDKEFRASRNFKHQAHAVNAYLKNPNDSRFSELSPDAMEFVKAESARKKAYIEEKGTQKGFRLAKQPANKSEYRAFGDKTRALRGSYAHPELAKYVEQRLSPAELNPLNKAMNRANQHFKFGVTVPWPGFQAKLLSGHLINNQEHGVAVRDYLMSLLAKHGNPAREFKSLGMTAGDLKKTLQEAVINEGHRSSELRDVTNPQSGPISAVENFIGKHGWLGASPEKVMNANVRFNRDAAYTSGLRRLKDPYAARQFVAGVHGDYGELTPAEEAIRANVPFYKWARTNLPNQVRTLATNPGRFMVAPKLIQNIEDPAQRQQFDAAGHHETLDQLLGMAVLNPLAKEQFLKFGIPQEDLNRYMTGHGAPNTTAFIASLNPVERLLIQAGVKATLYSNSVQPMQDFTPAKGAMGELARAMSKTPLLANLVIQGKGGEYFLSKDVANALSTMPTSRLTQTVGSLTNGDKSLTTRLLSFFSGVSAQPYNEGLDNYLTNQSAKDLESQLNRLGVIPHAPAKTGTSSGSNPLLSH